MFRTKTIQIWMPHTAPPMYLLLTGLAQFLGSFSPLAVLLWYDYDMETGPLGFQLKPPTCCTRTV